ncbi:MAG: hypothetical protein LBR90_02205 [Elusimicrobiota bacterium]|nr:hypothetical protein [Elusimicrobiota bacterium]
MKKLLLAALSVMLLAGAAFAQDLKKMTSEELAKLTIQEIKYFSQTVQKRTPQGGWHALDVVDLAAVYNELALRADEGSFNKAEFKKIALMMNESVHDGHTNGKLTPLYIIAMDYYQKAKLASSSADAKELAAFVARADADIAKAAKN